MGGDGMGDQFSCVRIFFCKPLQADNGARFFPALYVMRDIFFHCRIFFARYFLATYFSLDIGLQDNFFSEITHTPPQTLNGRPSII